eukprot:gene30265-35253_t
MHILQLHNVVSLPKSLKRATFLRRVEDDAVEGQATTSGCLSSLASCFDGRPKSNHSEYVCVRVWDIKRKQHVLLHISKHTAPSLLGWESGVVRILPDSAPTHVDPPVCEPPWPSSWLTQCLGLPPDFSPPPAGRAHSCSNRQEICGGSQQGGAHICRHVWAYWNDNHPGIIVLATAKTSPQGSGGHHNQQGEPANCQPKVGTPAASRPPATQPTAKTNPQGSGEHHNQQGKPANRQPKVSTPAASRPSATQPTAKTNHQGSGEHHNQPGYTTGTPGPPANSQPIVGTPADSLSPSCQPPDTQPPAKTNPRGSGEHPLPLGYTTAYASSMNRLSNSGTPGSSSDRVGVADGLDWVWQLLHISPGFDTVTAALPAVQRGGLDMVTAALPAVHTCGLDKVTEALPAVHTCGLDKVTAALPAVHSCGLGTPRAHTPEVGANSPTTSGLGDSGMELRISSIDVNTHGHGAWGNEWDDGAGM